MGSAGAAGSFEQPAASIAVRDSNRIWNRIEDNRIGETAEFTPVDAAGSGMRVA